MQPNCNQMGDSNSDPEANDPEARRRRTRKEVRHDLIRRTYRAYMTAPRHRVPEFRRTTIEAVRKIREGWKDHFDVKLRDRTIYRALGLRPPANK